MSFLNQEMVQEISEHLILHWNYRGYSSLPLELWKSGHHVCELYLKYNNLKQLPDWLDQMTNLTNIYLQANYLTELPECIKSLVNLEILDVSQNNISRLPHSIGNLKKLKKLVLTQNCLTTLPNSIGELSCLVSLQLNNNFLKTLPYALSCCTMLQELCIDCNKLEMLPTFLTRLPNLEVLSVCGNQLVFLPLVPFASIRRLQCDSNPYLSHLPYPLACQMNKTPNNPLVTRDVLHISCYGCFSSCPVEPTHCVEDPDKNGDPNCYLSFPSHLQTTSRPTVVPSLMELVLRSLIYYEFGKVVQTLGDHMLNIHHVRMNPNFPTYYNEWVESLRNSLPCTLIDLLRSGPTAFCFNNDCGMSIFKTAYPVFVPKIMIQRQSPSHVSLQRVLCCLLFCSPLCFRRYEHAAEAWETQMLDARLDKWTILSI